MKIFGLHIPFTQNGISDVVNVHRTERDEQTILHTKVVSRQLFRINATVGKWRSALSEAENVDNPDRTPLMEVYQELVLDTHLSAIMQSRSLAVTSQKWNIHNKDGEINEELTAVLNKDWFDKFVLGSIESIFYGYTLFQFDEVENGKVGYLVQFPRENVDPDRHFVKSEQRVTNGTRYDEPPFSDLVIFVGDEKDLGLLNKSAPLVMYKKDAWANWADFQEIFGIPPRIGRTDVRNKELRKNMETAMISMGKLFFAVLDKDDSIELIESSKGDAFNVFLKLIEAANKELSKLFLGQTGTTDEKAFTGSSQVHERKEQMITRADVKFIERVVNDDLLPLLKNNGWKIPEGAVFSYDKTEQIETKDRFEMVIKLIETGFAIPDEFITEKFNIPVTKLEIQPTEITSQILSQLNDIYPRSILDAINQKKNDKNVLSDSQEDRFIKGVFDGKFTTSALPVFVYNEISGELIEAVEGGYGSTLSKLDKKSTRFTLLKKLNTSIFEFSAAKTYQEVKALEINVFDKAGIKKPFADFKKEAQEILGLFNKTHAKTEFETSFANSQSANKWNKIESQKDVFPLLKYRTQLDEKVRDEHVALEGIIRPVDDDFWSIYTPTNGYNCRCFLEQLESGSVTPINQLPDMIVVQPLDPIFRNNPGRSGVIFNQKHPYFQVPKKDKGLKEDNFGLEIPL